MNKLLAIAALTLLSVCLYSININTVDYKAKFEQWTTQYNKNYSSAERAYRQAIYEENLKMIEAHNADPNQSYTMGENQFADLTHEEFVEIYLTIQPRKEEIIVFDNVYIPTKAANPFVDWSNLTKVGDQGNCKSSWAFATASEIESVYRIKNVGTKEDLSVQQLVDCDTIDKGCTNGSPDYAYYFVMKSGLVTASQYPYAGVKQACAYPTGPYKITKMDYVQYENLYQAISEQPVSVEVDASYWTFYSGGILTDCKHSINHAALAVGYYADGTWIIKNSWGTSWGENGFIRLGAGDTCAVGQYARIARV